MWYNDEQYDRVDDEKNAQIILKDPSPYSKGDTVKRRDTETRTTVCGRGGADPDDTTKNSRRKHRVLSQSRGDECGLGTGDRVDNV